MELEVDLLKAIDQILDLTDRLEKMESHFRQLVRSLKHETK